ncbi:MAG: DEAD/DEAH box helicase [bacterium]
MNRVVEIELGCQITLDKNQLPTRLLDQIKSFLTLDNPRYKQADEHGYSTYGIAKFIYAYHEDESCLYAYRGYIGSLLPFLTRSGLQYRIIDDRRKLPEIELSFRGTLRPYQERAVTEALRKDFGIVVAPCGAGKTVIACAVIASRKQPTLIIVHTKELLNQWRDRLTQYLGIPLDEIGVIGAGKELIKPITVGMVQTLAKRDLAEIRQHFGQIIVDEVHHCPASTFNEVITSFDCQYQLGLSATPYRRDGLGKLIYLTLGNVATEITDRDLQQAGTRIKPEIVVRETGFDFDYCEDSDYQPMVSALIADPERNALICADVISENQSGENLSLILSDRKAHLADLAESLHNFGVDCAILTGDVPKKQREQIIRDAEGGKLRVILATGQLAGEGLDLPKLNRLFVTTPIRFRGRITQYIGRALRTAEGKTDAKVYDYVDPVGILQSSYRSRQRVYDSIN